jgi:hypothetical protein
LEDNEQQPQHTCEAKSGGPEWQTNLPVGLPEREYQSDRREPLPAARSEFQMAAGAPLE